MSAFPPSGTNIYTNGIFLARQKENVGLSSLIFAGLSEWELDSVTLPSPHKNNENRRQKHKEMQNVAGKVWKYNLLIFEADTAAII